MIKMYKKKPVTIRAVQYTGNNVDEIMEFGKKAVFHRDMRYEDENELFIETLEGSMHVSVGDFVIEGVHGEFYPCKPDIFEETYDEVK